MPARHIIYQLAELPIAARSSIGASGVLLGSLWEQQLPIPASLCIPSTTLIQLAQDAQFHLKIEQLQRNRANLQIDAVREHIVHLLKQVHLDQTFLHTLSAAYHEYLQADTVQVYASELTDTKVPLVMGDATLIQAVLDVWSALIAHQLVHNTHRHRSVSDIVGPTAILITRQPQAVASGTAYSQKPGTHDKTRVHISAVWGSFAEPEMAAGAEVAVDVRTMAVVEQRPHQQRHKLIQGSGELITEKLTSEEKEQQPLSEAEARALAHLVLRLKRQTLEQVSITWIKADNTLYITGVSDTETDSEPAAPVVKHPSGKTVTQLYITAGNPDKAGEYLAQPVDGVGVLRSEYYLAQFGTHPEHLLNSPSRDALRQAMLHTISAYQREAKGRLILFRTENFTSAELLGLRSSASYTEAETNPAIGMRGALKQLQYPELLNFQLDTFRDALEQATAPLGILFPFVRSPEEARRLVLQVKERNLRSPHFAGIWLQLNTPENCINFAAYPLSELAGIVVNVSSVLALSLGIDADRPELQEAYSFPHAVYEYLLDHIVKQHTPLGQLKTVVYLRHFDDQALTTAVRKGVHGVIVRPNVASVAKASIMEAERSLFTAPTRS